MSGIGELKNPDKETRDRHELRPCFVIGIGASAGGQGPLEHFFTTFPGDCQLAFVVVMHLPADGPPLLSDLVRRYTPMDVYTAEDGAILRPNTVHVIPPGADLIIRDGRLWLESRPEIPSAIPHPIDRFFLSLAEDFGEKAIGVVLSGAGRDGALGGQKIKNAGGAFLVQDPETALYPAMPSHAIATGAADYVLPVEEITEKIAALAKGRCNLPLHACRTTTLEEDLTAIFAVVKAVTGHDFSSYKRNTVLRRLERRMTLHESGGLRKYLAYLEQNPREAQALAQEILIGVTRFFRDAEAFDVLRGEVLPHLFENRDPEDPVRIWHACCATGEEAYSVAMLVREHLEREKLDQRVQMFATDIDEGAVAQGRAGLYPEDVVQDVGVERLKAFFTGHSGRLQVAKDLREMILFANHNLIKDPPFSRLDLLVCRNFLIYLNPDMQKRLISLFHMVLKPGGYLFLGASESTGANSGLFTPLNQKWKIFRRLECDRREESSFPFTTPALKFPRGALPKPPAHPEAPSPGALAERLLVERYAPPCAVVNDKYEVLHISSRTRRFLEVPIGKPTTDLLKMAREELRPALRAAIYKAFTEQREVNFRGVKLVGGEGGGTVNIKVEPLDARKKHGNLVLVTLEPEASPPAAQVPVDSKEGIKDEFSREVLIRQLEEQLRITHEQLQFTTEQLAASNEGFMATNEELMSINEEFQSANEELQSTNEELEASKEELQALNEELVTVNAELQGKVEELDQAKSDMENLFASSGVAAAFLDRQLIIKNFSPAMAGLLNLIPADIGRPFRQMGGNIDWSHLPGDSREVLEKHVPVTRESVSSETGRCFIMRVLPYRDAEGNVAGIVITLTDITELKRAEEETLSTALFPLENPEPVLRIGPKGNVVFANRSAEALLSQWQEEFGKRIPDSLRRSINEALADGVLRQHDVDFSGGCMSFNVAPIPDRGYANLYGRDITGRKQAEEAVRQANEEWKRTFDSVPDLIAILDDQHRITRVNRAMAEKLGLSPAECIGKSCFQCVHGADGIPDFCPHALTMKDGLEHTREVHEDTLGGDFLVSTTPLKDSAGQMIGSVHVARDISERIRMEDALRESERRLRLFIEHAPAALAMFDREMCYLVASHRWRQDFKIENTDLLGVSHYEFFPEIGEKWKKAHQKALTGQVVGEEADRFDRADGSVQWVRWEIRPWYNFSGEVGGIVIFVEDITDEKLSKEKVRYQNELLTAINRMFQGALTSRSEEELGNICLSSALDVTASQIGFIGEVGKDGLLHDIVISETGWESCTLHDPQGERRPPGNFTVHGLYGQVLRDGKGFFTNDPPAHPASIGLPEGHPPLTSFLGVPLLQEGRVIGMVGVGNRDGGYREEELEALEALAPAMVEAFLRLRAEKERNYANQRLALLARTAGRLLASDAPQEVVDELCRKVMDVLDCQVFFNFLVDPEVDRLHLNAYGGIPEEEAEKIEWLDFGVAVCGCAARDACRIVAEEIPDTPDPRTDLVKSYGILAYACHPLMVRGQVLGTLSFGTRTRAWFSDDELAMMKAVADQVAIAMERRQGEEELKQAHEELENKVRARTAELREKDRLILQQSRQAAMGEMINNIAHQWRQPLNGLGLIVQSLPMMLDSGQLDRKNLERVGEKGMDIIFHMSQTIDDFRNYFKPDKEKVRFSVRQAISRTIKLVGESLRNLEIDIEVEATHDPVIYGYPNEFGQVLLNILINARDAFSERKVIGSKISINLGRENGKAVVIIADNAGGIRGDILNKIFEPYFTTKGPEHGTGIGLFMSKTIIEKNMGGKLAARNTADGAEFKIEV